MEVNYSDPGGNGFGMAYAGRTLRHPKKYRHVHSHHVMLDVVKSAYLATCEQTCFLVKHILAEF